MSHGKTGSVPDPTTNPPNPIGLAFRRRRRAHVIIIAAWLLDVIVYGLLSRKTPHAAVIDVSFAVLFILLFVADTIVWRCPRCGRVLLDRGTAFPLGLLSCPGCGADFEP